MLLLSRNKKIALLAVSLFLTSLSVLFVLSSSGPTGGIHSQNLSNNLFGSFFGEQDGGHGSASGENSGGEAAVEKNGAALRDEKTPTLIMTKTADFVDMNAAFAAAFGYEKDDFQDQEFFSFFHAKDLPAFVSHFTKVTQGKATSDAYAGPFRFSTKSGKYRLVIITAVVEKNNISLRFKDITDSAEKLQDGGGDASAVETGSTSSSTSSS